MTEKPPLTPARPDAPEAESYKPRLPWRWIVLAVVLVPAATLAFRIKEQRKADALRKGILAVYLDELAPTRARYRELRTHIETWARHAAGLQSATYVHPGLNLAQLRSAQGLYLRVPKAAASSSEALARAARAAEPDAITRCLGLSAYQGGAFFAQGAFLDDAWIDEARTTSDVMRLRVIDEMLATHIEKDLPGVVSSLKSQWFMLVLQSGENRWDAPVQVFLWDLKSGTLLLQTRVKARGVYLRARIRSQTARRSTAGGPAAGPGAHDCSIASQIRALQGTPLTEVQAQPTSENRAEETR